MPDKIQWFGSMRQADLPSADEIWFAVDWCHPVLTIQNDPTQYRMAVWLGSVDGQFVILAQRPWASGSKEHGIVPTFDDAMRAPAVKEVRRPKLLLVQSEELALALAEAGIADRYMVAIDPRLSQLADDLMYSFVDFRVQTQMRGSPVELVGPTTAMEGVDHDLVTRFLGAMLTFWRAKPWTTVSNSVIVKVTRPGGSTRVVSIMGNGKLEYGALVFQTWSDIKRYFDMSSDNDAGMKLDISKLPPHTGLVFDFPEELPAAMEDYLGEYKPEWLNEVRWPRISRMEPDEQEALPGPEDYETAIDCLLAIGILARRLKPEGAWPPKQGKPERIRLGRRKNAPEAIVEILGTMH